MPSTLSANAQFRDTISGGATHLDIPDIEFWFSGYAIISFAGLLFALVLAALGVGPVLAKNYHKRIVWSGVAIIAALTWWQLAKQEEEKAKPQHDYVYLGPSKFIMPNGMVVLSTISTGTLRNVRIAVQRLGTDGKPEPGYIYSNGINGVTVDEGTNLSQVTLPIGSYAIDIDPPTKFGKTYEWIKIVKSDNSFTTTIRVIRKGNREVLIPAPGKVPFTHKLLLLFFSGQFLIFASVLAWGSWVTS